jgi:hypothetical protein
VGQYWIGADSTQASEQQFAEAIALLVDFHLELSHLAR